MIIISTSGRSRNIINVAKLAQKQKIFTIAFLGSGGGKAKNYSDLSLIVTSKSTARIQELHIFLGHYIFEEVEKLLIQWNQKLLQSFRQEVTQLELKIKI